MDKELVEVATGEIVEQTPEDLLLAARDAAQALERVIELNDKPPLVFRGKRYLEIHHWQTIGKFYGCSVRTSESDPCEIDGVKGFIAKCDLLNDKTGAVVGGSVAYCMRDEPQWKEKPMYALASMAQTRAGSKALSNKFRFVAILAGYEGCPSEEVTDEMKGLPSVAMPKAKVSEGSPPEIKKVREPVKPLTKEEIAHEVRIPQSKFFAKLHQLAREKKVEPDKLKWFIKETFNKESSKDLFDSEVLALIQLIEKGGIK